MIEETLALDQARCFYDSLGPAHDLGERFERRAKARALSALQLAPRQRVLNIGVGTGKEQAQIQQALLPGGVAVGIDLSPIMLRLSRRRVPPPGALSLCEADARHLPFAAATFDRVFSSYVLDLIPGPDIPVILSAIYRVLQPGGRLVLVGLTEGTTVTSRTLMAAWKALYHFSPYSLGGCRPLRLTYPLLKAGFAHVRRDVVVQGGMPSEILVASRPSV